MYSTSSYGWVINKNKPKKNTKNIQTKVDYKKTTKIRFQTLYVLDNQAPPI